MSIEFKTFESRFGFSPPAALVEFLGKLSTWKSFPLVFRFSHLPFILEIQYLLSLGDEQNYDVERKRMAFAVNSDGATLLVDLGTERLDILQEDFGYCDTLGLSVQYLLDAEWCEWTK